MTYFVAALQTIAARQHPEGNIGDRVLTILRSPQLPPTNSILTVMIIEITAILEDFALILDDYHAIDTKPVDNALNFSLEHLRPQMHLVIATRQDPLLPPARSRARSQLTELRAADLRFTRDETTTFLSEVMGLSSGAADLAALGNNI